VQKSGVVFVHSQEHDLVVQADVSQWNHLLAQLKGQLPAYKQCYELFCSTLAVSTLQLKASLNVAHVQNLDRELVWSVSIVSGHHEDVLSLIAQPAARVADSGRIHRWPVRPSSGGKHFTKLTCVNSTIATGSHSLGFQVKDPHNVHNFLWAIAHLIHFSPSDDHFTLRYVCHAIISPEVTVPGQNVAAIGISHLGQGEVERVSLKQTFQAKMNDLKSRRRQSYTFHLHPWPTIRQIACFTLFLNATAPPLAVQNEV